MSARKQNTHVKGTGLVPRKRARQDAYESESSSSEESSKTVEKLKDEDTDLRVSVGKRTPSKRVKQD